MATLSFTSATGQLFIFCCLERAACRRVSAAIETGANVMVITNAESGWIEYWAARFLPELFLLDQLKVVG